MFRIFLAFFLLVALTTEVSAQRGSGGGGPRGGGGGGPRGPGMGQRPQRPEQARPEQSRPEQPDAQPERPASSPEQPPSPAGRPGGRGEGRLQAAEAAAEPGSSDSGVGTVPKLATPADKVIPLTIADPLLYDTIVPSNVPYKVVRYASRIMEKYDLNGNGMLEREEWSKMPGSPQSIDTDGDFVISLEELIRFIALYGSVRTIHRPNPPPDSAGANWNPTDVAVFKPLSSSQKPKVIPVAVEPIPDETEEIAPIENIGENPNTGESTPEPAAESGETPKDAENEGEQEKTE